MGQVLKFPKNFRGNIPEQSGDKVGEGGTEYTFPPSGYEHLRTEDIPYFVVPRADGSGCDIVRNPSYISKTRWDGEGTS